MIVYEVDLEVDNAIADEFDAWLERHARDMCALPGFTGASLWKVDDDTRVRRVARYTLIDRAALDRYLDEHAPAMRADGVRRFGTRFAATRRVLAPFAD